MTAQQQRRQREHRLVDRVELEGPNSTGMS
jgi:hypothetical protein